MDFKKKRLNKALEDKTYRVKLVHGKKGWLTVGLTFVTLFSATALAQKTVDASAVNNVATANSTTSSYVQLWNDVTKSTIHQANRGLANGTDWKTAKAVKGTDGNIYLLVGGNEYANANQMDLRDETSKQNLAGVVHVGDVQYARLYTNPLDGAKLITNRALQGNSDWKTDTKVTVDGVTYYRVSTNEWVKANDANLTSENSRSDKTYIKNAPDEETPTTTTPDTDTNNGGGSSSGSHNGGGSTTTDNATITIHYVDSTGKTILADSSVKAKIGSNYDAYAKTIDGYSAGTLHQIVKVAKGNNDVTFMYLTDEQAVNYRIVIVLFNDEDGHGIGKTELVQQKIGDTYTAKAQDIDGYTVKGGSTQDITISGTENNVVTFTYTKNVAKKVTATVRYQDESGRDIKTPKLIPDQEVGTTITADAPKIEGYELDDEETKDIPITDGGDNSVTFKYKKTTTDPVTTKADVTVNYVDETGKAIADPSTTSEEIGSTKSVDAKSIDGYDLTSESSKSIKVDKDSANNVITFTYKANDTTPTEDTANVTVHYQDESGKTLRTDSTTSEKIGSTKTVSAEKIDGYTVKGNATKDVTVDKAGNEVTFTYTKNADPEVTKSEITVNYVTKDGKVLDSTTEKIENGTSYTAQAKEFDGYTLDGDESQTIDSVDGNQTLTFNYTKNPEPVQKSTITVKYVGDDDKVLDTVSEDVDNGTSYTANAKEFDGYTLSGDNSQTIDSVDGNQTLTFNYTKKAEPVQQSTITSKFVGDDGKILDSTSETVDNGTSYTANAKTFDGYTLDGSDTQTIDSVSGDKVLTFIYTKNAEPVQQSTITTKYVDEKGTDIATAKSEKVDNGTSYTAKAVKVDGYTLKGSDTQIIDSVSGDKVVTFTYTKDAPQATVDTSAVASKLISMINDYRVQNGLKALTVDSNLQAASQARATEEAGVVNAGGTADHKLANGSDFNMEAHIQQYGAMYVGENLLVTNGSTVDEVAENAFNQWKNHDEHNKNMLGNNFSATGLSVVELANGQFFALQDFAGKGSADVEWNPDQFNSAPITDTGATKADVEANMVKQGINLTGNYYVADYLFKTDSDAQDFIAADSLPEYTYTSNPQLQGSIWGADNYARGNAGDILVYDKNGKAIGWAVYMTNMEKSIDELTADGLSTWIK